MRQLGVIRDKQAFSAAEVARGGKNTSFVVLAQECFCLFRVYPGEWPLKYPMVLCSLRDSELAYSIPLTVIYMSFIKPRVLFQYTYLGAGG